MGTPDFRMFREPLGIDPDFVLVCDVKGYNESGNIVIHHARTIRIELNLMNVKTRKTGWSTATSGFASQSFLLGGWGNLLTRNEEDQIIVRRAMIDALETLPPVKGFKAGPVSPIDKK